VIQSVIVSWAQPCFAWPLPKPWAARICRASAADAQRQAASRERLAAYLQERWGPVEIV